MYPSNYTTGDEHDHCPDCSMGYECPSCASFRGRDDEHAYSVEEPLFDRQSDRDQRLVDIITSTNSPITIIFMR